MDNNTYQHAERFFPWNLQNSVLNSTIFPYWSDEAFYYFQQTPVERLFLRVD